MFHARLEGIENEGDICILKKTSSPTLSKLLTCTFRVETIKYLSFFKVDHHS